MLAFDIETTGLDPRKSVVTCVCVQDFHSGQKWAFEFAKVRHESPLELPELQRRLVELLEAAPSLCAFNGIRFDTPFLQVALGLDLATMRRWNCKTSDILEHCRNVHKHTFSLNLLCEVNGIPVKTGDGLQAIYLARDHQWPKLLAYCEHDVHILCELYRRRYLKNPRNGRVMDLAECAAGYVYADLEKKDKLHKLHKTEQNATKGGAGEMLGGVAATPAAPAAPAKPAKPAKPAALFSAAARAAGAGKPSTDTGAPDLSAWLQAVATRLNRLPVVEVPASDVFGAFGAGRRFCVAQCPTCDAEGFIQEDTQQLAEGLENTCNTDAVYACSMRHAYRLRVRE